MTILFIWLGITGEFDLWRKMCIFRAKKLYPEAKVKIISSSKKLFDFDIIDAHEIKEKLKENNWFCKFEDYILFSDYARFYWLMNYKNTLYLDTDTWCKRRYEYTNKVGNLGIEAIWNGNSTNFIKNVFNQRVNNRDPLIRLNKIFIEFGSICLSEYFEHKPLWAKQYRKRSECDAGKGNPGQLRPV